MKAKKENHRKTLYERVTGKKPYPSHDEGIRKKPITDFMSFNDAQVTLGHAYRGSTERMLHNGSIRFVVISPDNGMVRMVYKPDVLLLAKALQSRD